MELYARLQGHDKCCTPQTIKFGVKEIENTTRQVSVSTYFSTLMHGTKSIPLFGNDTARQHIIDFTSFLRQIGQFLHFRNQIYNT